jgi:hypothetical protein
MNPTDAENNYPPIDPMSPEYKAFAAEELRIELERQDAEFAVPLAYAAEELTQWLGDERVRRFDAAVALIPAMTLIDFKEGITDALRRRADRFHASQVEGSKA